MKQYIEELRLLIRMYEIAQQDNAPQAVLEDIVEKSQWLAEKINEHR